MPAVSIRVLGPLEVDGDGVGLGPRDRVVLAALVLRRGEVVAPDRLADALWGEEPPASAPKVVQGCIARLRKALGTAAIETTPSGYRLALAGDDLDVHQFEDLVERARGQTATGQPERAVSTLSRALTLWRGDPFPDLDDWPPGRNEAARLDELRRTAEEDLLDARLAAGEHREVAAEGEARVAEEPLRERRWATLALAQYRCGRQADALRSLHRARRTLTDQLGIDPGPELVALEAQILRQDPELAANPESLRPLAEECPYKGLAAYDVDDTDTFFGRDADVAACVERLAEHPLLVIAGPSGCGKSSLARAGVAPALQRQGRTVAVFAPGPDPETALTSALASASADAVLIVDQFEELFTLAPGAGPAFCRRLADHATNHAPVVVVVRADHLAALAGEPAFARLAERGLHLVGPLTGDALREAIEGPAARAGLRLEDGLVDLLVRDTEGEPGALPLLSHALAETWRRRDGRVLTVEAYRATGGIRGAVARSADRLYESLPPDQRSLLRSVLLRLVAPSPDGEPVRSRLASRTLGGDPARARVVHLLVRARLVTAQEETVELAHEALARAWPRLRSWLDEDASGQRILRHLVTAADGWEALGRPASELYRGARLETAREWQASTSPDLTDLTDLETEFLDASDAQATSERESLARRARQQARQNRRLRVLLVAAAVFLVVSIVAAQAAVRQRDSAEEAATVAEARRLGTLALTVDDLDQALLLAVEGHRLHDSNETRTNLLAALNRRPQAIGVIRHPDGGVFREVAVTADGRYLAAGDIRRGLYFYDAATLEPVAEALGGAETGRALAALPGSDDVAMAVYPGDDQGLGEGAIRFFDAATGDEVREPLAGLPLPADATGTASSLAVSPDGRYVAASVIGNPDQGAAQQLIWDLEAPDAPPLRVEHGVDLPVVAFTPTGDLVVAGESDSVAGAALTVVDPATGAVVTTAPVARAPFAVSPDGRTVAARQGDRLALFDLATGTLRRVLPTDAGPVDLTFSRDGRSLTVAGEDRTVEVWDVASGRRAELLEGHTAPATAIELDAEGRTLFSASPDGTVVVWDLAGDRRLVRRLSPPAASPDALNTYVTPSPDGTRLAYRYSDQVGTDHFALRDFPDGALGPELPSGHPYAIWHDWTPDGRRLLTLGNDGTVRAWDPATGRLLVERPLPFDSNGGSIGWRPGGATIFVGLHAGGVVELDAATLEVVGEPLRFDRYVPNVDVSPDGELLAVAQFQPNAVLLVERASGRVVATVDDVNASWQLEFSPDGSLLAAGGDDGLVTLIDPESGRQVGAPLPGVDGPVLTLAFSPDGDRLVTSSQGTVELWDVRRRQRIVRVTPGDPGPPLFAWFADDGRTVVAADDRGGIWSIPSEPDAWVDGACAIAGRNLTRTEWDDLLPTHPYRRTCPTA